VSLLVAAVAAAVFVGPAAQAKPAAIHGAATAPTYAKHVSGHATSARARA
jgi:hypothetical protein